MARSLTAGIFLVFLRCQTGPGREQIATPRIMKRQGDPLGANYDV